MKGVYGSGFSLVPRGKRQGADEGWQWVVLVIEVVTGVNVTILYLVMAENGKKLCGRVWAHARVDGLIWKAIWVETWAPKGEFRLGGA